MNRHAQEIGLGNLGRTATVFAPHPDDETLGCGGTILKKKRAGAKVKIIFVTDGGKSHPHLISENKLKIIRSNEALAASRTLGLKKQEIIFLEYKDKELGKNLDSATHRVSEILNHQQPDEIFIPYHKEPSSWSQDHLDTNRIALNALIRCKRKAIIYEYPIGLWNHPPWVNALVGNPMKTFRALKQGIVSGESLLNDFKCSVYIGDVLKLKRAALNQHKSQMTRLIPDLHWHTLSDLSTGEFLNCFFQEYEFFHKSVFDGKRLK
jgi:LmbE family N-acetylglucosaminyl deacetylase